MVQIFVYEFQGVGSNWHSCEIGDFLHMWFDVMNEQIVIDIETLALEVIQGLGPCFLIQLMCCCGVGWYRRTTRYETHAQNAFCNGFRITMGSDYLNVMAGGQFGKFIETKAQFWVFYPPQGLYQFFFHQFGVFHGVRFEVGPRTLPVQDNFFVNLLEIEIFPVACLVTTIGRAEPLTHIDPQVV